MLDVDRRVDVDPGIEELLDVGIALGVAAPRNVGVRELVDEHDLGPAGEDRVDVHLLHRPASVLDALSRNHLEAFEQGLGLAPAMGLDHADDDSDPVASPGLSRQQHLVGLAYARCCAQKDLQAPAALLLRRGEQRLRRRPSLALRHRINIVRSGRLGTSG